MKWIVLAMALLVCESPVAEARLGETFQEIAVRYGPPAKPAADLTSPLREMDYLIKGNRITVSFLNGHSVREFTRVESIRFYTSDEELDLCADISGKPRAQWKLNESANKKRYWYTCGELIAYCSVGVDVQTPEYKSFLTEDARKKNEDTAKTIEKYDSLVNTNAPQTNNPAKP